MKRRLTFISLLIALLVSPLTMMAEGTKANIFLMASGKAIDTVQIEVGQPLGYLNEPDCYPFRLYYGGGWATNETGDPQFVNEETIVKGDMKLYYVWIGGINISRMYYKRVTKAEDIDDEFYLVSADGKHAMKRYTDDHLSISYVWGNSYTSTVESYVYGEQMDVNMQGDEVDFDEENNPLGGCLSHQFYNGNLMNEGFTSSSNWAFKNGDGEPYFGMANNTGNSEIGYLGYKFNWSLSFTDDGYAKLTNEDYGYIYYSETPSERGVNFRLSKTATPNLIAYKLCQVIDTTYIRSLDYNIVHVKVTPEDAYGEIQGLGGEEYGGGISGSYVSILYEDAEGNPYDTPVYAIMKGYSCPFFIRYDHYMYKGAMSCDDPTAGQEGTYDMHGEDRDAYIVTPTQECTVTLHLTYDPVKTIIGSKVVPYSYDEVDVYGDKSVLINGTDMEFTNANVDGNIVIPFDNCWANVHGTNNFGGGIETGGFLRLQCNDEEAATINMTGNIHCTGNEPNVEEDNQPLVLYNVELYINPAASAKNLTGEQEVTPALSGFTAFTFDEDMLVMATPKNGYYDKIKLMLVDANDNPVTKVAIMTTAHYKAFLNRADINGDNVINIGDVTSIIALIMDNTAESKADINGDGVINIGDLTELIARVMAGE